MTSTPPTPKQFPVLPEASQAEAFTFGMQRMKPGIFAGDLTMFSSPDGKYVRLADAQSALLAQAAEKDAEIDRLRAEVACLGKEACNVGYAHFSPFYLLANARGGTSREFQRQPNWVIAEKLFAVGSTSANRICREAGIDPDAFEVRKVAADASRALAQQEEKP